MPERASGTCRKSSLKTSGPKKPRGQVKADSRRLSTELSTKKSTGREVDGMKQVKKLTRDQKIRLVNEGKDPKQYAWSAQLQAFVRKDGKQEDVVDRKEGCSRK